MKINQIYSLLNDINAQMFGEDAIDVHDLSGIVSLGDTVVGNSDNTDLFIGKLVDRIGKTVIRTLDLELDFPALFMDSFEFGAILQKITVNPFEAIQSSEWKVGEDGFTPTLLDVRKPEIMVRYFKHADTWKFQCSIPDDLLFTAFTSETAMSQFIDAIINAMTDSMTIAINNMSRTCVNNFIAEKIKNSNGVINLLPGYNTLASTSLTPEQAIHNKEFLRYAVNEIRKFIKYMSQPSTLYNVGDGSKGVVRATARDNMHVLMLTDFIAGVESYLQSDTFHDELLGMPMFSEVAYWQGNKGASTQNDFETNSSIKVTPSSEEGQDNPSDVEQSGVICVLADRQAIAVGINKRRSGNFYNSIDAYSNISQTATIQYINDLTENGLVFTVATAANPLTDLTVKAASGTYYDVATSTYQTGITVKGGKITGTLKYLENGIAQSGPLAGAGYFLALSLYDSHDAIESMGDVKVGLTHSRGTGLVSIKGDPDDVIVMKISDIEKQKFKVVSTKSGYDTNTQIFSLADLKLQ